MSNAFFADDQPTNRVLKRAQYEQFAFSLLEGDVLVRNESYADPSEHEYRVTITDGKPTSCECPADERYDGPCKHRTAVAIRSRIGTVAKDFQAVLDATLDPDDALLVEQIAQDEATDNSSGANGTDDQSADEETDGRPADCECSSFNTDIDLACWPCYRGGFEEPPVNDSG